MDNRAFDTSPSVQTVTSYSEMRGCGISWGAILAGVFVALTVATILNLLGVGLDLIALGSHKGTIAQIGGLTIVWIIVSSIVSMLAGGWVAGRMCGPTLNTEGALHGIVMCGVSFFFTFILATSIGGAIGVMAGLIAQSASMTEHTQVTAKVDHFVPAPTTHNAAQNNPMHNAVVLANQQQYHQNLQDYFAAKNPTDEAASRSNMTDYLMHSQGMTQAQAQQTMDAWQNQKQMAIAQAEKTSKSLGMLVLVFFAAFLLSAIASAFGGLWGAASDRELFIRREVKVNKY